MKRSAQVRACVAGFAIMALGLSACASDSQQFDTIDELVDAYHAAGGDCEDFVVFDDAEGEADAESVQTARCGSGTVLTVTDSDEVTSNVATGAMLRGETVLIGPGWIIQDPNTVGLRDELGGSLLALQEGSAPDVVSEGAFVFGSGEPRIQVVVDPLCDYCNRFIEANGEELIALADSDDATVEYRVVSFHDDPENGFGSSYSLNALACAADANPASFRPLLSTILAGPDGSAWTEESLVSAAADAGADVADCVDQGRYLYWGMLSTHEVRDNGLPDGENLGGVPYISIDGVAYAQNVSDAEAFADAVADAR